MTIDELVAAARSGLCRLHSVQALAAMHSGAALIDIRSEAQIARAGTITGARVIARKILEWRRSCPASVLGIWPGYGRDADALLLSWRSRGLCGVLLNLAKLGYSGGQVEEAGQQRGDGELAVSMLSTSITGR